METWSLHDLIPMSKANYLLTQYFDTMVEFPYILGYFFCLVFAMPLCTYGYMCLVVTCWERADILALVCGVQI